MLPMDHRSFRDLLTFGIGFAIQQNRDLMLRILKEHVADDARQQLAKRLSRTSNSLASRSTNRPKS
jgi:hypothetical protein